MITKYENLVTFEQANKIKKEVKALNNRYIQAVYRQTDDSTYKTITISICNSPLLEEKLEAIKVLKTYCEALRIRVLEDKI